MQKLQFASETTSSENEVPLKKQEISISPEVKNSQEAKDISAKTVADLSDLYNDVEVSQMQSAKKLLENNTEKELKNKVYNSQEVRNLQSALKMLGMDISVDGDFGDKTEGFVKSLQTQLGLETNGIFDSNMKTKLLDVINNEITDREFNKMISEGNTSGVKEDIDLFTGVDSITGVELPQDTLESDTAESKANVNLSTGIESFQEKPSGNHISKGMRNETIFNKGEMTREEAISHMNVTSLEKLLRVHNASDIVKAISQGTEKYTEIVRNEDGTPKLDTNGNEMTDTRLNFNFFTGSYSQAEKWLEDNGYDSDGVFDGMEMTSIHTYALEMMKNQETAKNNSSEEKFKQLIDFDNNGFLQTGKNFYIGELQAEYLNQTDKVGSYENLYTNLGLNLNALEDEMTQNYFTAQEKFQQRLSTYLQMGIKPGELFVEGGLEKAMNQMYADIQEGIETVKDNEAEVLYIKGAVKDALVNMKGGSLPNLDQESEAIALEAIHVIAGGANGLAANFNISKFTNDLVRDLSPGIVNGQPGIMISRGFFEGQLDKYDISVSGGLLNVIIPIVSISADVFKEKYPKADVIHATGDDYKISVFASASTIGQAVGVQYTESSFETSTGIESLGEELSKDLDTMIDVLDKNENAVNPIKLTVEESGLTQDQVDAANKLYDNYFSVLQNIEQKITGNKKEKAYFENAKDAIVNGYKDKLYRNVDGKINFASAGAGVAFAAGILPVPFVTASFERVKTHFEEQNHSNERERKNTEQSTKVSIEKYHDFDALVFDNKYNISVPQNYILQANTQNDKLYIGGDIQSIRIHEHVQNDQVIKTLVINGGSLNTEGLYETTNVMSDIVGDVNIDKKQVYETALKSATENTLAIREDINTLFSHDALKHKSTKGAIDLQKSIYNYVNGDTSQTLAAIYQKFIGLVLGHMTEYAKSKGQENELYSLQEKLFEFDSTNEQEQLAILQSVNANFMKKGALENKNCLVSMKKNIAEYDRVNNRAKFFDGVFTEKYGAEFAGKIAEARTSWMAVNGDKNTYNFTQNEGNLAMTGVTLGTRGKGVMSYEGVYNIAEPEGGKAYVTLDNNPAFINNLPNNFLVNIQSQLKNAGVELATLEEVKKFINNGGDARVQISYELAFARMGECLNDAVILKEFSINTPKAAITSLTSTMNTQSEKVTTLGITLVDEVKIKDKLEEADTDSKPTETDTGAVDENGNPVNPGDTTIDENGGFNPNTGGETVIDTETARKLNEAKAQNIKNIVPNIVQIGNDTGKGTGKNMND